jgi:hypothetical protein
MTDVFLALSRWFSGTPGPTGRLLFGINPSLKVKRMMALAACGNEGTQFIFIAGST